jgi:hypothetical protein
MMMMVPGHNGHQVMMMAVPIHKVMMVVTMMDDIPSSHHSPMLALPSNPEELPRVIQQWFSRTPLATPDLWGAGPRYIPVLLMFQ